MDIGLLSTSRAKVCFFMQVYQVGLYLQKQPAFTGYGGQYEEIVQSVEGGLKVREETGKRKWVRAVMTVELALLTPLILTVIFAILYLDFHTQNRVTMQCAAVEQAVSGNEYEDILLMGGAAAERTASENAGKRQVSFSSRIESVYGGFLWDSSAEAEYELMYPVDFIWKVKTVQAVFDT